MKTEKVFEPQGQHMDRLLEHYSAALFDTYDEILELNVTKNTYRLLFYTKSKFTVPNFNGTLDKMLLEVRESNVHPDDGEKFKDFMTFPSLMMKFKSGLQRFSIEYRKRVEKGGFTWVQLLLIPIRDMEDEMFACYIVDIDDRKRVEQENDMLQEICGYAIREEYKFAMLIDVSAEHYVLYPMSFGKQMIPHLGAYDQMLKTADTFVYKEDLDEFIYEMSLEHLVNILKERDGRYTIAFRSTSYSKWKTPRWMDTRLSYFKNIPTLILAMFRDIHDAYLAEQRDKAVGSQFLYAFGNVYTDVVEANPYHGTASIMKFNAGKHKRIFDKVYTLDDILSRYGRCHLDKQDTERLVHEFGSQALVSMLESGCQQKSIEVKTHNRNSSYQWNEISAFALSTSESTSKKVLLTVRNVNDHKLLKGIVDRFVYSNCDYFIYLDAKRDSYVMFSGNDQAKDIPVVSNQYSQVIEDYIRQHVVPEDVERALVDMSLSRILEVLLHSGEHVFYIGIKFNGSVRYKRLQYLYYDKHNQMIMMSRTDATQIFMEEKRKNDLLINALKEARSASQAKTDFLSRMSHDIRTPMNAITGMAAIAATQINDPVRVMDCLQKINQSSQFLLSLINDVLDMSKIESGRMHISKSPFDFVNFIHGVTTIFYPQALERGIRFEIYVDPSLERTYIGDSLRLNQILFNLLSNAIKFTPTGGTVSMGVYKIEHRQNTTDSAMLRFVVQDTGCGMTEKFMGRMYDPFEQELEGNDRNEVGSGLGLAIIQSLVRLMDGRIKAKSTVGVGSIFEVELELGLPDDTDYYSHYNSGAGAKNLNHAQNVHQYNQWKAIVADSSHKDREHLVKLLTKIGIRSLGVSSWNDLTYILGIENDFQLMFVEESLCVGNETTSLQKLQQLVSGSQKIPCSIIYISPFSRFSHEEALRDAGVNGFLYKPFFIKSLHDLLASLNNIENSELNSDNTYTNTNTDTGTGTSQDIAPDKPGRFKGERVLLVEDNDINREIARTLLEFEGLVIQEATDGQVAVEMFMNSNPGYFSAVLMDIRMPNMDGLSATKKIRASTHPDSGTIPIIAMSANAFQEDIHIAEEVGMNHYLVKPLDVEQLYKLLEKTLYK